MLAILFFLVLLYPINGYSAVCWGSNQTCSPHIMTTQYEGGNITYSYFTPESVCNSCVGDSDCNNTNPLCTKQLVNLTQRKICPVWNFNLSLVTYNVTESPLTYPGIPTSNDFSFSPSLKRDADTTVKYIGNKLYVTTSDLYHTFFIWHVNECDDTIYCATSCETEIKPICLTKNGVLTAKVFVYDTLVTNASFSIEASETCIIKDCSFICMDYFTNFVCYSLGTQIMVGVSFIVSMLTFLILVLYGFYRCHNKLTGIYTIRVPASLPQYQTTLLLCFVLLFACASAQCTTSTVVSSTINSCSFVNGTSSCSLQLNQNIILPHLGSKSCVSFSSDTGDYIGFMNISYILSLTKADTVPLYYTASWIGESCSSKSCRHSDYCDGSGCTQDQTTLNSYLSGQCLLWPGKSRCETSCGCAGCLCFHCQDACLASRYAFRALQAIAQVFDILSTRLVPRILIETLINGTKTSTTIDVTETAEAGPFSVGLLGSFDGPNTIFGNNKFVIYGGSGYLAQASNYNNPQFGTVGDIQATTPSAFATPSQSSFIYPSSVPTSTVTQSSVIYNFPSPGIFLLNGNTKLPKVVSSQMWTASGTSLQSINNDPPAISIAVTSAPLTLTYTKTRVCPVINSATINGCYNCPGGFSITLDVNSACDDGAVAVKLETASRINCFNTFIQILQERTSEIIYCTSLDKQISGEIILKGDTESRKSFSTVLNNPPPLTQQEIQDIFGNYSANDQTFSSISDLWNSFSGSAAIAKWVIVIVISIIILFIIGTVIYVSYNWYVARQVKKSFESFDTDVLSED